MVRTEALRRFLIEANKAGYAAEGEVLGRSEKKEGDGSTTITFESGEWKSADNYAGGEPYSGATKVSFKDKIVFMMVYYGAVTQSVSNFDEVYGFLRKALRELPHQHPYRGPKSLTDKENKLEYHNFWEGELDQFSGHEEILKDGQQIYWAKYLGGLVDQR